MDNIERMKTQLEILQEELSDVRDINAELRSELNNAQEYQQKCAAMENSKSWKLTKPLRSIDLYLKKRIGGGIAHDGKCVQDDYAFWIEKLERGYEHIDVSSLKYKPIISVLVPVYNVLDRHLIPCINSVLMQEYPFWELCLVDDCSTFDNVIPTLEKYKNDEKIKIAFRDTNGGISECTNTALSLATGEYIALLDCDDTLSPNALSEVIKLLNEEPSLDFIYSDEDLISDDGKRRHSPQFKPDWSPDTFMSWMYTCHLGVFRRSIASNMGGFKKVYDGAQDYDFVLRFTEQTDKIAHIPKILYHWRERKESSVVNIENKSYAIEAQRKAKVDAITRRELKANLEFKNEIHQWHVNYIWDKYPKVSVIIPSKDNYVYLARCITTFVQKTKYNDYELIVVDNGSQGDNRKKIEKLTQMYGAKYVYEKKEFNFSYMCDLGASYASGEYFLFLNDDTEIIEPEWLKCMVGQAMLPYTGAVGAKLLYPDKKTIQSDGVINKQVGPCDAFRMFGDDVFQYYNVLTINRLAVTGACLLLSREKFESVGGFSEELRVSYNDIDLCFKLAESGYYNVVRNDAVLIHHESISRGNDLLDEEKTKRLYQELGVLYYLHPEYRGTDPFYNPNLA